MRANPAFPLCARKLNHSGWFEGWVHELPQRDRGGQGCIEVLRGFSKGEHAAVMDVDLFGDASFIADAEIPISTNLSATEHWFSSSIIGRGTAGLIQGGLLGHYFASPNLRILKHHGRTLGFHFEDEYAHYCYLSGITPAELKVGPALQMNEVILTMERVLASIGMTFRNVVRTWFYLDDILSWYGDFNCVRTAFFESRKVFGGIMPASTGVGAANPEGSAVLAKLIAVQPKGDAVQIRRVESPLQCDAFSYGSAFSRALAVDTPSARRLFVSGTASIEPGGRTIHAGDTPGQIELSIEVVGAILEREQMSWHDVTRAVGYFRHPEQIPLWEEFRRRMDFPEIPIVLVQCDVCRDDLLFEIELDAVVPVVE